MCNKEFYKLPPSAIRINCPPSAIRINCPPSAIRINCPPSAIRTINLPPSAIRTMNLPPSAIRTSFNCPPSKSNNIRDEYRVMAAVHYTVYTPDAAIKQQNITPDIILKPALKEEALWTKGRAPEPSSLQTSYPPE